MTPRSWVRKVFARPATRPIRRATPRVPQLGVEPLEDRAVPATFTVLNSNDTGAGSLRDAVAAANAAIGIDTIVFGDGSGSGGTNFLDATPDTITLTSGEITFTGDTALTTVTGPGAALLTVSGGNTQRVFFVDPGISTAMSGLTVSGGAGALIGGGVRNDGTLAVTAVIFSGNSADFGGGLGNFGVATVTNTLFTANAAANDGGGLANVGTLTVTNSTFTANSALVGGGIANAGGGTLDLVNVTVSGNSASGGAGNLDNIGGTVTLTNTIVVAPLLGGDIAGAVTGTNNLVGTGGSGGLVNGVGGNIVGVTDARLGALADNGGPTRTMALLSDSPALNAGDEAAAPATDQRGKVRFGNTDIGAYEYLFKVTNTTDSGPGSLREAIITANTTAGTDTIVFKVGTGAQTIAPTSALPTITQTAVVDGTTQPGYAGTPLIEIDGQNAGNSYGPTVSGAAASNSTIAGLVVNRFQLSGIFVTGGASGVTIRDNSVGTDITGTLDLGNGTFGVDIANAPNAVVSGNLIAGNGDAGVVVDGTAAGARIVGNRIGLTAAGTSALPNAGGIIIQAANATVGGGAAADRNIISGNSGAGIRFAAAVTGTVILGNYIGTNVTGTAAVPNTGNGVQLDGGSTGTVIGDGTTAGRNVISGNTVRGVYVDPTSSGNRIRGNYIGTDAAGTAAVGNSSTGIRISGPNNTLGGGAAGDGNLISGNGVRGVVVADPAATGNVIQGNYIGTNAAGTAAIPNATGGVLLGNSSSGTTLGGGAAGEGNLISGNDQEGVTLREATTGNTVAGNTIGLAADGTTALPNTTDGIEVSGAATNNVIGGAAAGARNVISGNARSGVWLLGAGTTGNVVRGNFVGTDAAGLLDRGNAGDGVVTTTGADANLILGNVVSGNDATGILLQTNANTVQGNRVGTDATGTADLGNAFSGVWMYGCSNNVVGVDGDGVNDAAEGNVISGNGSYGVYFQGDSNNNVVAGNQIGITADGTTSLPNSNGGISFFNDFLADDTRIGTDADGTSDALERNVIAGNANYGIVDFAIGTVIAGNYVGILADGVTPLGNSQGGVSLGGQGTTVGGTATAARNLIGGNAGFGLSISGALGFGTNITVSGNYVGVGADGATAAGNSGIGVELIGGATGNTIGWDGRYGQRVDVPATTIQPGRLLLESAGTVLAPSGQTLYRYAPATGTLSAVTSLGAGETFTDLARGITDTIYALVYDPGSGNHRVIEIDPVTGAQTLRSSGGVLDGPGAVGLAAVFNGELAVADTGAGGRVTVIDLSGTQTVVATGNELGGGLVDLEYEPGGTFIAADAAGKLVRVDPGTGSQVVLSGPGNGFAPLTGPLTSITWADYGQYLLTTGPGGPGGLYRLDQIGGTGGYLTTGGAVDSATGAVPLPRGEYLVAGPAGGLVRVTPAVTRNVISANLRGVQIDGAATTGNVIAGNSIGTDATGLLARGNAGDGVRLQAGAAGNTVGGTAAGAGNVISGNTGDGVRLTAAGTGNLIAGNTVGLGTDGSTAIGNGLDGVYVLNTPGTTVGGTTAARNVLSANGLSGVHFQGAGTTGGLVVGNNLGTDATGTAARGNGNSGVLINFGASGVTVGGPTAAERNVISANAGAANVFILDANNHTVLGNYIGTDAAGTAALGGDRGVWVGGTSTGNVVGQPGAGNLISGITAGPGVRLSSTGNTTLQGNRIGTNAAGTAALPNVTGVQVDSGSANNLIGGTAAGAGNLISGNTGRGLVLINASSNTVQGNRIGTDAAGTAGLPNDAAGVRIEQGSANNTIGGTAAGAGNTIAFNGGTGVVVLDDTTTGNAVRGNSIHSNTGLGIDLGFGGVATNDAGDADTGPNRLTNYPLLSFVGGGATTNPRGTLAAAPNTTYSLDFYATDAPDPTGYGEGRRYLGSATVTTNAVGRAAVSVNLPAATTTAEYVTVTATDPAGNTSEFSQAIRTNQPPTVTLATPAETLVGVTHPFTPVLTDAVPGKTYRYAWAVAFNGSPVALPDATFVADGASDQETFFFTPRRVGTYVVSVTVTDSLGGEVTATSAPIRVTGTSLGVTITGNPVGSPVSFAAVAGQPVTLTSRIADPRQTAFDPKTGLAVVPAYTYRWTVTLGGVPVVLPAGTVTTAPALTFTPTAGGLYLVSLAVQDGAGPQVAAGADSVSLYATAAPDARLIVRPGTAVAAGAVVELQAVVLDAALRRGLSYRWTVTPDDGEPPTQATNATGVYAFTPKKAGNYAVALTVTDAQNPTGAATTVVVRVARAVPTVTVNAPRTTPPGVSLTVTGSATDADPNRPTSGTGTVYALSWRAIDTTTSQVFATGTGGSFSFTPPSEGNVVVTLTATGPGGVETSYPVVIGVEATDAALTVTPPANPAQGQPLTWTANLAGAPAGTTYTWSVFGPDGVTRPYSTGTANTLTVPAARPGRYDVTVTAAANGTRYTARPPAAGTSVDVPDAAVNVTIGVGPTGNLFEGDTVTLTGTATAPGVDLSDLSKASYLWTVTGPGGFSEVSVLPTLGVVPPRAGTYTATLVVRDLRGGSGTATVTFAVAHAPPKPLLRYVDTGPDGSVGFQAVVANPAGAYSFVYTVEVNGQPLGPPTPGGAAFPFRLPPVTGPTTLRVSVTDSAYATGQISTTVRAVDAGTPAAPVRKDVTDADLLPGTDVVVVLARGYNRVVAAPSLPPTTTVQFIAVGGYNRFKGGPSTNIFFGDSGTNVLVGGDGPNTFFASGSDTLVGGGGPNRFVPVTIGTDTGNVLDVVAGPGPNTLDLSQQDGVTLDLTVTGVSQPFDGDGNSVRLTNTYPDESGNPVTQTGTFRTVIGTPGADTLTAASGASIVGGGGADLLKSTGATNVTLAGGSGNNTSLVASGGGSVSLVGGSGSNSSLVAGGGATNVTLVGGSGNNTSLVALSGGVSLVGGSGSNSSLVAGAGNVTLIGGSGGNASLVAGAGNVSLVGGSGSNASLVAGTGSNNVTLVGGSGNNASLVAGAGNVSLVGGSGSNTSLVAGAGSVSLVGGSGSNASLVAGTGASNVTLVGGSGSNASLVAGAGSGNVSLVGGSGSNTSLVAGTGAGNVTLVGGSGSNASLVAGAGTVSLVGGSGSNASLVAQGGNVSLVGGSGSNASLVAATGGVSLVGGSGSNASLVAGAGNVTLIGGSGSNASLVATSGNVSLVGGSGSNASLVAGTGSNNVTLVGGSGSNASLVAQGGNVSLVGGSGSNASLVAGQGSSNVTLVGGSGGNASLVAGGGSNVTLVGGSGSNATLVAGGSANVSLVGGSGSNASLIAGTGNVSLVGGSGGNASLVAGQGSSNVTLVGGSGSNASIAAGAGSSNVSLVGGSGSNASVVSGAGSINVTLIGGSGNNTSLAAGGGSNVSLIGGSGDGTRLSVVDVADALLIGGQGRNASVSATTSPTGTSSRLTLIGGFGDNATLAASGSVSGVELVGGFGNNNTLGVTGATNAVLVGGFGDGNTLTATGGNNVVLIGGSGKNNYLQQTGGTNAFLYGQSGNNASLVSSGGTNVSLIGGSGDGLHLVDTGSTNVSLLGGTGSNNRVESVDGNNATVFGGNGNNNSVLASGGRDVFVVGGTGDGNRLTTAGLLNATVFGGAGNSNVLDNSSGTNVLVVGGTGLANKLTDRAGAGNTVVNGGNGFASLTAINGNNVRLFGGGGTDYLTAEGGANVGLFGQNGDNTYSISTYVAANAVVPFTGYLDALGTVGLQQTPNDELQSGSNTILFPSADRVVLDLGRSVGGAATAAAASAATQQVAAGVSFYLIGPFSGVVGSAAGNDLIRGNMLPNSLVAGAGDVTLVAGSGDATLVAGSGRTTMIGGGGPTTYAFRGAVGQHTITQPDASNADVIDLSKLSGPATLNLAAASAQTVSGALTLTMTHPTVPDVIGSPAGNTLTGNGRDNRYSLTTGANAVTAGSGLTTVKFSGAGLGANTVTAPTPGSVVLNFHQLGGPLAFDLGRASQPVGGGTLTFAGAADARAVASVVGTVYGDVLAGNPAAGAPGVSLYGGGGRDSLTGGAGADLLQAGVPQVVFLDFDTYTPLSPNNHVYTQAERDAIQARLQGVYAKFTSAAVAGTTNYANGYVFTQSRATARALTRPTGGEFVTLAFNKPPAGGQAEEVDFANADLGGLASVSASLILGATGEPDRTTQNFINLSAGLAAHELAHLAGLRHTDAFGPIGGGGYQVFLNGLQVAGLDPDKFLPVFQQPAAAQPVTTGAIPLLDVTSIPAGATAYAAETPLHVMGSPASVGITRFDTLNDLFFGEREAIRLAFTQSGVVAPAQAAPHGSPATAQDLGVLPGLVVPNTLAAGARNAGQPFAVQALAVVGAIGRDEAGRSRPDWYAFTGRAGDLMSFETISRVLPGNPRPLDTILRVYDAAGTLLAQNDDELESLDSLVFDFRVPADGRYYVQVDTWAEAGAVNTAQGDYVLYMTAFKIGATAGGGSTLAAGPGGDVLYGGQGNNRFRLAADAGPTTVIGGNGADVLDRTAAPLAPVTVITPPGNTGIVQVVPVVVTPGGPFAATAAVSTGSLALATVLHPGVVDPASSYAATIDWGDGQTSAGAVTGPAGGPFAVTGGHTYAAAGTFTVRVSVSHAGAAPVTATATVSVSFGQVTATGGIAAPFASAVPSSPVVATFTDPNGPGSLTLYSASINWGDGQTSAGTITGPVGGVFSVSAPHTYFVLGTPPTITVSVARGTAAPVTVTSTAVVGTSVVALNPSLSGAVTLSGSAAIGIGGALVVNSNSASALTLSGSARVTAGSVRVRGGYARSGSAQATPAPATGAAALADPLAGLPAPPNPGGTPTNANIGGNSSVTLNPGRYSQITVGGSARVTLTPGVYVIAGGGLSVSGSASLTGTGVMIYVAGSNFPGTGGTYNGVSFSGSAAVNLTPAATGTYAGIALFQARDNNRAMTFSGNAREGITGFVYAPNALLTLSGSVNTVRTGIVVDRLNTSGSASSSQVAAGSGTEDGSPAGELLSTSLAVYVDGPDEFSPAQLARIADAITGIDAVIEPYGVDITRVSDPADANVVIDLASTSVLGGPAAGVLGVYDPVYSQITLVDGWDWYAGADPAGIGAGQFDFQSVVTHELGHALGLGHLDDPASVMFESLTPGTAKRTLLSTDLNIGNEHGLPGALYADFGEAGPAAQPTPAAREAPASRPEPEPTDPADAATPRAVSPVRPRPVFLPIATDAPAAVAGGRSAPVIGTDDRTAAVVPAVADRAAATPAASFGLYAPPLAEGGTAAESIRAAGPPEDRPAAAGRSDVAPTPGVFLLLADLATPPEPPATAAEPLSVPAAASVEEELIEWDEVVLLAMAVGAAAVALDRPAVAPPELRRRREGGLA